MRRTPILFVVASAAFLLTVDGRVAWLGAQPQEPPPFQAPTPPSPLPVKQQPAPPKQPAAQPQQQPASPQQQPAPPQQRPAPPQQQAAPSSPSAKQQPSVPVSQQPPYPVPAPARQAPPAQAPTRRANAVATGGAARYAVEMTFLEPSGVTLGNRVAHVTTGRSEDIVVQDRQRTVTATTSVRPGRKVGCARVDVIVRDRTIDASGHFNKTLWESGSEPCGADPITLGPKDEVNVRISVHPDR